MELAPLQVELKKYIQEAASNLYVQPAELSYNDFQKWFKSAGNRTWIKTNASKIKQLGGFTNFRDSHFTIDIASKLDTTALKLKEDAKNNRNTLKTATREQVFLDKLESILSKYVTREPKKITPNKKNPGGGKITRELNILLSDLHFGSDLNPAFGPALKYGRTEEARRLAYVVKSVCSYKMDHRNETRLRVHLAGDIIQGQLHDLRDGDILAAQCARAIHLLEQAISTLAANFPEVVVDCCTGNHDRITSRHKERGVYEKSDSLATIIYYSVKKATKHLDNVKFDITLKPYIEYESFGNKCFGTHGDTVLNPGYPGNTINAKNLETQINRINASLPNSEEFKLFFVGHVHVGTVIHMSNGATLITNGPLTPSDQYSVSIGLFESSCGQSMWESTPEYVVGDYRFIRLTSVQDNDKSLDEIISPFEGF